MDQQLPTPLLEIIVLHLYISSVTLLLGVIVFYIILKSKNNFTWEKYVLNAIILLGMATMLSLFIWQKWPFGFDIMFGPFNLPTLISLVVILGFYASIIKTK